MWQHLTRKVFIIFYQTFVSMLLIEVSAPTFIFFVTVFTSQSLHFKDRQQCYEIAPIWVRKKMASLTLYCILRHQVYFYSWPKVDVYKAPFLISFFIVLASFPGSYSALEFSSMSGKAKYRRFSSFFVLAPGFPYIPTAFHQFLKHFTNNRL